MSDINLEIGTLRKKVEYAKVQLTKRKPLSPTELKELDNYFRLGTTQTSNAIEGNTLTLLETKLAIEDGITVGGKRLSEYAEALGHAAAFDFMLKAARDKDLCFTEKLVKDLHYIFSKNISEEEAGKYRLGQVFISTGVFVPPPPEDVPELMKKFIRTLNFMADSHNPVDVSAFAHRELVTIHPFTDGNGRTARLLMNLVLIHGGYYPISLAPVNRPIYYQALIAAQRPDNPDSRPFTKFIYEQELETLKDVCRLFNIPVKTILSEGTERSGSS